MAGVVNEVGPCGSHPVTMLLAPGVASVDVIHQSVIFQAVQRAPCRCFVHTQRMAKSSRLPKGISPTCRSRMNMSSIKRFDHFLFLIADAPLSNVSHRRWPATSSDVYHACLEGKLSPSQPTRLPIRHRRSPGQRESRARRRKRHFQTLGSVEKAGWMLGSATSRAVLRDGQSLANAPLIDPLARRPRDAVLSQSTADQ